MQIDLITTLDGLAQVEPRWRELAAGQPFSGPAWLGTWWRHFGADDARRELALLAVCDGGRLVGLAPWYVEHSFWGGRTLRFLGTGAVCSEYLTLPVAAGYEERVADAIAGRLCPVDGEVPGSLAWDLLRLEDLAAGDAVLRRLAAACAARGAITHTRPPMRCWRLELPETWNDYLGLLTRQRRRRVRRMEEAYFDTKLAQVVCADTPELVMQGFQIWAHLHEQRWAMRGQAGVFAVDGILDFHREACQQLWADGQLWMMWLEIDGRPVAAEYALTGPDVIYAYQSGMDPEAEEHTPGTLALVALVRKAIERGYRKIDFLRGDEPYKRFWRAQPRATEEVRVLPGDWSGRMRQRLWQTGQGTRHVLRWGRDAVLRGRRDAADGEAAAQAPTTQAPTTQAAATDEAPQETDLQATS